MGKLFDKLNADDVRMIDDFISKKVSSDHREVSYLLREWDTKKETLYKMFGNQFILNKKIEFNKPIKTLREDLNGRFSDRDNVCNLFRRTYDRFLWEHRIDLGDDYDLLQGLLDLDRLINTEYDGDTFYVKAPDGKEVKVQHGCKPMRLISKICKLYNVNDELLTKFQNEISLVLNQKKLTGDLSISIHPLDYMTMSENECDWTSCMNWSEPGCYCRGTVEMMNSPIVVVAYLNAKDKMQMPGNGEWSNKKWRELFLVTPEIITGVKGYPYQNEEIVQIVNSWLRDLATANLGWEYDKNNVAYKHGYDFVYTDDNGTEHNACFDFRTDTMYNDFGTIEHHYAIVGKDLDNYRIHDNYSGREECMVCGGFDCYFDNEGSLACNDCDDCYYCRDCGCRISADDVYWLDDEPYCYDCYQNAAVTDPITEEEHNESYMRTIYLVPDEVDDVANYLGSNSCCTVDVYDGVWNERPRRWSYYFNDTVCTAHSSLGWGRTYHYVTPSICKDTALTELFGVSREDL